MKKKFHNRLSSQNRLLWEKIQKLHLRIQRKITNRSFYKLNLLKAFHWYSQRLAQVGLSLKKTTIAGTFVLSLVKAVCVSTSISLAIAGTFVLSLAIGNTATAQTSPANDDLANAIGAIDAAGALALPFSHTVISAQAENATNETGEVVCENGAVSWWYKFKPTQNGTITVISEVTGSTIGGDANDIRLGIYAGPPSAAFPSLIEVICTDNNAGAGWGESQIIFVTANINYYIRVAPSDKNTILNVTTSIAVNPPPANDDLANAIGAIDATGALALPFSHTVFSSEAKAVTAETNEAVCKYGNESWWYKVTPTQDGAITVISEVTGSTIDDYEDDINLGIYTGTTFPLTEVICTDNDNGAGYGESETINVTADTTYYIRVGPNSIDVILDVTTSISFVAVLPVELISFTATAQDNRTNLLEWQTASEENNEGFEVQRNAEGQEWQTLGFVKGNGTTLKTQNYTFIDEQPIGGNNYYRLKQTDFDGQFEYSNILSVKTKVFGEEIKIYPNPVQDELTITNTENVKNIVIYNALGQLLRQFTINNSQLSIHVSDLPKGIYILKVQDINGVITTQQFLK